MHAGYQFNRYRKALSSYKGISTLVLCGVPELQKKDVGALAVMRDATFLARDLINTAPNDCTPSFLVSACNDIAKSYGGTLEIFDQDKLAKLGANTLLAVSKGSDQPPYLIKLVSAPKHSKRAPVVALVGKGVTFDSGGLSIKTSEGMMEMKADMSGAAAVIGAMQAILQLQPQIEVRGYIPTVENMINGQATRPGDVVTSLSGKTVEILNTDAEGRLILCDAITMAERDGADIIIDVATLTGACVVALGTRYAGLFTDDDEIANTILAAARHSGERFWRMPLAAEYNELLDSSVADMKNIGIRWGGAITAALFLKRFITKARWAHLDIAGPAFDESGAGGIPKGGMGFAVRTLVRTVLTFEAEV
jgi:leucyl aminopeptidase